MANILAHRYIVISHFERCAYGDVCRGHREAVAAVDCRNPRFFSAFRRIRYGVERVSHIRRNRQGDSVADICGFGVGLNRAVFNFIVYCHGVGYSKGNLRFDGLTVRQIEDNLPIVHRIFVQSRDSKIM